MKKIGFAFCMLTLMIMSWACKKSTETPSVSFSVSALDSAKVSTLTTFAINNIIQNHIDSFFVSVPANTPTNVYNKTLYFKYTGGSSDFRVIYTGDTTVVNSVNNSHVYDPLNDSTINYGYTFSNTIFSNQYSKAGTYTVTVVARNLKDNGKDFVQTLFTKKYIMK